MNPTPTRPTLAALMAALLTTGCMCSTSFGESGAAHPGDFDRMQAEIAATTAPAEPGDDALALPAADLVKQLGLPAAPRKQKVERRKYPDGSWSVFTVSEPEQASLTDPTFVTEVRVFADEAAAREGFEWYERSRGVELSWSDLEFEPPSHRLADGARWNQMTGGAPGGGTEVVIALHQKGRVLVYGIIGNLKSIEPAAVPYEAVIQPAFARAVHAAAKRAPTPAAPAE